LRPLVIGPGIAAGALDLKQAPLDQPCRLASFVQFVLIFDHGTHNLTGERHGKVSGQPFRTSP